MGRTFKAVEALAIAAVLLAYVVGQAVVQAGYPPKVEALKRDLELYDLRGQEIYREKVRVETVLLLLESQLAGEREAARVRSAQDLENEQVIRSISENRSDPMAGVALTQTAFDPRNITVDTSSIQQALKLAEAKQKARTVTQRVTRAS